MAEEAPLAELTLEDLENLNVEDVVKHAFSLSCGRDADKIQLRDRITTDLKLTVDNLPVACNYIEKKTGIRFEPGEFKRCRTVRQCVETVQRYVNVNMAYL